MAEHPGLRLVLAKLHRRAEVTDNDLELLRRQIELLEQPAQQSGEPDTFKGAVATAIPETMVSGYATREGTEKYAANFGNGSVAFYRAPQDVLISSVGIGTYRGAMDDRTDGAYAAAVNAALTAGVNLIDTAPNYRQQRSELAVATGVRRFMKTNGGNREGIGACTKGGYLVPGAFTANTLRDEDVVGGRHSIAPAFLADQIDRSRRNLGLKTVDIYYLHNPETQLNHISRATFLARIRAAFSMLERAVSDNLIRYYGTATWHGYLSGALDLRQLVEAARQVGGENHHFRFVQLPFNLGMQ